MRGLHSSQMAISALEGVSMHDVLSSIGIVPWYAMNPVAGSDPGEHELTHRSLYA